MLVVVLINARLRKEIGFKILMLDFFLTCQEHKCSGIKQVHICLHGYLDEFSLHPVYRWTGG